MSLASDLVDSGKFPADFQDGINEMTSLVKGAHDEIKRLGDNTLVPATRFQRDPDTNEVVTDADGDPVVVLLTDEHGNPVMEEHPLVHRLNNHGLHAYRYETMSDGSVVALYVNSPDGAVHAKAFDSIEEASLWSPRDERVTEA